MRFAGLDLRGSRDEGCFFHRAKKKRMVSMSWSGYGVRGSMRGRNDCCVPHVLFGFLSGWKIPCVIESDELLWLN